MKRSLLILVAGVVLAFGAYCGFYYACTTKCRCIAQSSTPELAWLKSEFHLSDSEFGRISEMHQAYLAGCAERCRIIDMRSEELKALLAATNTVTPQIENALTETSKLRAECQSKMLQHFYEVSRTMPPDQGKRYLAWVQSHTILLDTHSQMHE